MIAGFGILVAAQTYMENAHQKSFLVELLNPVSIALVFFPFLVAALFMYLSRRADKDMERILRQHQSDLQKGSGKGKS